MRRSFTTALVTSIAAAGLAATAAPAFAGGTSVGTPVARADSLVAAPCPTYYRSVTLAITDFGMELNGQPAPSCLRLRHSGTLKIVNEATGTATVTLEGDTNEMVIGELWNLQPVGNYFAAGTVIDFEVDELFGSDTTIQVF